MDTFPPRLETMRSETFPFAERYAHDVSSLGQVCYFDAGVASHLPPVVMIHALGLNLTQWEYIAPTLASHTRVAGLDLPGCGRSIKGRHRYSLRLMSEAVVGLLDRLGIARAVLMGHSYGGRVAMDVALQQPDRVSGLVLMNSAGFIRYARPLYWAGRALLHPFVVAPLMIGGVNFIFRHIFAQPSERTERFIEQILGRYDSRYAWEFADYTCPMLKDLMSDVLDQLGELTLPMLVLWGEQDALLSLRAVGPALARLPDATLHMLPDCGHMPNFEQPEVVSAQSRLFLEWVASEREGRRITARAAVGG